MRELQPVDVDPATAKRRSWWTRTKPARVAQRTVLSAFYRYPTRNLLILGLPKSGTSWFRKMLCQLPGYVKWTPSNMEYWGDHTIDPSLFVPGPIGYTVTRVHSAPSAVNRAAVREISRPYVVLMRDLRDVTVSYTYFVDTNFFGAAERFGSLDTPGRIDLFIEELLPKYVDWVDGWSEQAEDDGLGLVLDYNDLIDDTVGALTRTIEHFGLTIKPETIAQIAERNSFKKVTGREAGEAKNSSFIRKGTSGDWRNHFTDAQLERFNEVVARTRAEPSTA